MSFVRALVVFVATAANWLLPVSELRADDVRVFAAASLATAMTDVARAFETASGHRMRMVLAGSSTLARQIEAGAQADIFISADNDWMDHLAARDLIDRTTRRALLGNRLVLVVAAEQPVKLAVTGNGDWLKQLGNGRIAMGDPAHVPVGKYTRAALQNLGHWGHVKRRLAPALDTRAALALVERGEAVAGFVYATDAAASTRARIAGVVPSGSYPPIAYPVARLKAVSGAAAVAAYRFICGAAAAAIFKQHGFEIP